ncbi:hypothetical protein [Streptomyces sp. NPDC050585]|uniref:hypothetical protein n=1 Tax=Streptomyces sp. NPDC050585 TaxID=3365632 RepID=UPI0037A92B52
MSSTHFVLHDPEGRLDANLPLDRELHKALVKAALGWTAAPGLPPADLQQIALLLCGTARAVAADVRRVADLLPGDHAARRPAEIAAARERLRQEENLVLETAQWLCDNVMPIKTRSASSYAVKHLIEDATGIYMTNGVFIAAALIVGYPFRYDEPNVLFGMSRRDLSRLR